MPGLRAPAKTKKTRTSFPSVRLTETEIRTSIRKRREAEPLDDDDFEIEAAPRTSGKYALFPDQEILSAEEEERRIKMAIRAARRQGNKKKPKLTYEGGGQIMSVKSGADTSFVPPNQQGKWPGPVED
jgi:hypothetical protein